MNFLSDDVLLNVFSFLHHSDIAVCFRVCENWREMSNFEPLFQHLYQRGLKEKIERLQEELTTELHDISKPNTKQRRNYVKKKIPKLQRLHHFSQKFVREEGFWKSRFMGFVKVNSSEEHLFKIKNAFNASPRTFSELIKNVMETLTKIKNKAIINQVVWGNKNANLMCLILQKYTQQKVVEENDEDLLCKICVILHDQFGVRLTDRLMERLATTCCVFDIVCRINSFKLCKLLLPRMIEDIERMNVVGKKWIEDYQARPLYQYASSSRNRQHDLEMIKLFIESGLEKDYLNHTNNETYNTAMNAFLATRCTKDVFLYLIEQGAVLNDKSIHFYIEHFQRYECTQQPYEYEEMFKNLLKHKINVKSKILGNTALHACARILPQHQHMLQLFVNTFISLGLDINEINTRGETPLNVALQFNKGAAAAKIFLKKGAKSNISNSLYRPVEMALNFLRLEDKVEVVEELLKREARVDEMGDASETELFFVVHEWEYSPEKVKIINLLLKYGADPNARERENGRTIYGYHLHLINLGYYSHFENVKHLFKDYKLVE